VGSCEPGNVPEAFMSCGLRPAQHESREGLRSHSGVASGTAVAVGRIESLRDLDHDLDELQQVLRSRYLISYKPALFKSDGQYRAIDIAARKSGHKLRVYARRGYYARVNSTGQDNF
jgi:hypothetical protein